MLILSEEQLNNLNKEALVIIAASLQDQMQSLHSQLDTANAQLADTNRQIELLTEQIRIMNQRQFGRHSESNLIDGQLTLFDSFNEAEATADNSVPDPTLPRLSYPLIAGRKLLESGKKIWTAFPLVSSIISFPKMNLPSYFQMVTRNSRKRYINDFISYRKHSSWTSTMSMSTLPRIMTALLLRLHVR